MTFSQTLSKIVNIPKHPVNALHHRFSNHPTLKAILKYKNHLGINTIRCITKHSSNFYFSQFDKSTVTKEIKNLEIRKVVQDSDIPVKLLRGNPEFFAEQICCQFNEAICSSIFPASFKLANITPVFKVGSRNQKNNYRPKSNLLIIGKIFEKLISQQLSSHFDNIVKISMWLREKLWYPSLSFTNN